MGFPNFKNKHAEDAMYSPQEFLDYSKRIRWVPKIKPPKGAIMCYSKSFIELIKKKHKTEKIDAFGAEFYMLKETNNQIGLVGNFGIGAPAACVVLEEMISWGIKRFITIGTAGTLQKNLKVGDLIVCEKAIRDEGTSHHYIKNSKYAYASKKMTEEIENSLKRFKQKYIVGTSWTIDAPYRETVAEARQYQKEGVHTVEMEASALFAVAKYRNVDIGALFTISDSLAELEWDPQFHRRKLRKKLKIIYKVALDVLLND